MKSLEIRSGDLVVGQGGHTTVSGTSRVIQDMGLALQEEYEVDRFHPRWGSLLQRYIGLPADERMQGLVKAEVTRVIQNWVTSQLNVAQNDRLAGRRPRFYPGELVKDIVTIQVSQPPDQPDRYDVLVVLELFSGEEFRLVTSVEG